MLDVLQPLPQYPILTFTLREVRLNLSNLSILCVAFPNEALVFRLGIASYT